jgi:diadenosine tetraphosphate (Ap4A) HIT family hydrolase
LHELSAEEFSELSELIEKTVRAVRRHFECEKEYVACFAEAEGFNHVHVHVIAKPQNLSQELKGTAIFSMLKASEHIPVAPGEIKELCEQLQDYFS